jgi:hypothetical protein
VDEDASSRPRLYLIELLIQVFSQLDWSTPVTSHGNQSLSSLIGRRSQWLACRWLTSKVACEHNLIHAQQSDVSLRYLHSAIHPNTAFQQPFSHFYFFTLQAIFTLVIVYRIHFPSFLSCRSSSTAIDRSRDLRDQPSTSISYRVDCGSTKLTNRSSRA